MSGRLAYRATQSCQPQGADLLWMRPLLLLTLAQEQLSTPRVPHPTHRSREHGARVHTSLLCSSRHSAGKPRRRVEQVRPEAAQSRAQAGKPSLAGALPGAQPLLCAPERPRPTSHLPSGFPGSGESGSMYESSSSS